MTFIWKILGTYISFAHFPFSDATLIEAISEILEDLSNQGIKVLVYGSKDQKLPDGLTNLEPHLRDASVQPLPSDFRKQVKKSVKAGHSAIYIFTSGTTGIVAWCSADLHVKCPFY